MIFDDEQLVFNEEEHSYTYEGIPMRGVTSWIGTFKKGFDAKYWSKRKAREMREVIKNGEVPEYLKKVYPTTWESEYEKRKDRKTPITAADVKKAWKAKGKEATDEGTLVHNEIEDYFNGALMLEDLDDYRSISGINAFMNKNGTYQFDMRLPEVRVCDPELRLAGTVDLIALKGDDLYIFDWKTNKKDLFKGFGRFKKPVNEFEANSFNTYILQLSTYAYILERQGLTVKKLFLVHLNSNGYDTYEVDYRKDLVQEMIKYEELNEQP